MLYSSALLSWCYFVFFSKNVFHSVFSASLQKQKHKIEGKQYTKVGRGFITKRTPFAAHHHTLKDTTYRPDLSYGTAIGIYITAVKYSYLISHLSSFPAAFYIRTLEKCYWCAVSSKIKTLTLLIFLLNL